MNNTLDSEINDELSLRELLAIDRTILSNQRTFLAYIRTALTLLLGGVGLRSLLETSRIYGSLGLIFIIISIVFFILGIYKFIKKKKHIDKIKNMSE
ncbi:MAG: DUF202 domain-containing protein [Bacillota bacterium]